MSILNWKKIIHKFQTFIDSNKNNGSNSVFTEKENSYNLYSQMVFLFFYLKRFRYFSLIFLKKYTTRKNDYRYENHLEPKIKLFIYLMRGLAEIKKY